MPLVIYLGWHVFTCNTSLLKPSEKTPLTLAMLQDGSQALDQEGLIFVEKLNDTSEILSQWFAADPQRTATLVWPKPHAFIAACLAQGEPAEPVIQQWQESTQAALKLFRHHRRQLALVGAAPGEHWAEENVSYTKHISMEAFMLSASNFASFYSLAALQLVDDDSSLKEALNYITASSYACSTPKESTKDIVGNALLSLKTLQSEQEQAKVHIQDIAAKQQSAEAKIVRAQTQVKDISKQRDEAKAEVELLLVQLHTSQETLEATLRQKEQDYQLSKSSLEVEKKHHKAAAKSLKNAEAKVSLIMQQYTEIQNENTLLLEQLHSVQEAFEETCYTKKADIERKIEKTNIAYQQNEHQLKVIITWLRAHAYRNAVMAYRNSKVFKKTLAKQVDLLQKSEYFNAEWYLEEYKDIAEAKINPAEHYLKFGAIEGRDPSPLFDTKKYLINHPDVAASGQNPLAHYLRDGIHEQRLIKQEIIR